MEAVLLLACEAWPAISGMRVIAGVWANMLVGLVTEVGFIAADVVKVVFKVEVVKVVGHRQLGVLNVEGGGGVAKANGGLNDEGARTVGVKASVVKAKVGREGLGIVEAEGGRGEVKAVVVKVKVGQNGLSIVKVEGRGVSEVVVVKPKVVAGARLGSADGNAEQDGCC